MTQRLTCHSAGFPGCPDSVRLQELQEPVAQALTEYLENEGQIFLMLNEESRDSVHEHFLSRLQLPYQLDETESENRLTLLSWIDFEHPIFVPFQGAQYNDFSSVHFYQFTQLNVQPGTNESEREHLKVLARFESTGEHDPPAILEFQLGQGTVMLWTFTPSLRDTNLPRNVKFLPLLFETLNYLAEPLRAGTINCRGFGTGDSHTGNGCRELADAETRRG